LKSFFKNIISVILFFFSINIISFAQDTSKPVIKPVDPRDTIYFQNFILADHNYQYINKSNPDTLTRRRFLWYPAKSLEDIFNYIPGYYQYTMDVGQLNPLSFNQYLYTYNGVLRHGRPINDMIDGTVDWNLLSRNEISEIELSNGFGNNVYGYSNSVNIIQRELFQFRPYTEMSFYQDRYENLYLDANFHQNFFRKLNFNFGITKHSYDGHYTNSDFDKWLGRFNLNFASTNKLNFFANVNYAHIQKGLNEGINADTVNLGDKSALFDAADAIVNNSDAYEIKERFDVDLGTVFLSGKSSFTKLQFYVSNSFRKYRDEENRSNPNGIYVKDNYHWINYGAQLQEVLKFNPFKDIRITSRTEVDYNYRIINTSEYKPDYTYSGSRNFRTMNFLEDIALNYNNFTVSGFIRAYTLNDFTTNYMHSGIKAGYSVDFDSLKKINISAQFNSRYNYTSLKAEYSTDGNSISGEFYYYKPCNCGDDYIFKGVNSAFMLRLYKFDLEGIYSYNIVPDWPSQNTKKGNFSPEHYGNLSISWHDVAFKNKLEYKIGLNSRFWSKYYSSYYNGQSNYLTDALDSNDMSYDLLIPANATLDFYIIGKIGKATFGLTLENILDRIVYNTGVYPFMDRGGFLNTISRFNITWNFFD